MMLTQRKNRWRQAGVEPGTHHSRTVHERVAMNATGLTSPMSGARSLDRSRPCRGGAGFAARALRTGLDPAYFYQGSSSARDIVSLGIQPRLWFNRGSHRVCHGGALARWNSLLATRHWAVAVAPPGDPTSRVLRARAILWERRVEGRGGPLPVNLANPKQKPRSAPRAPPLRWASAHTVPPPPAAEVSAVAHPFTPGGVGESQNHVTARPFVTSRDCARPAGS